MTRIGTGGVEEGTPEGGGGGCCGAVHCGGARTCHKPWVKPPVHRRRTCNSADNVSVGAASTKSGVSVDAVAASSGAVTTTGEAADGLHPATEAPESGNTMTATTVATAIRTNQAEKEGNKARHLTDKEYIYLLERREIGGRSVGSRESGERDVRAGGTARTVGQGEIFP
ncbi:uncharacterized protein LOC123441461 [Hordeum vulgare subsp. vulgare]|uniref:uncharacterized protein LOC123441461 n=1 Tax=Hordeum vulgare subsp. vulgare TaxID=112509 RepID=UPI001D1A5991|nr:uncharacterized protein LOC123441461 [Hordeum vulgare subsp. vulgare]